MPPEEGVMAESVKISDEEMALVRAEADLNSRSIAGQITHWMRIGRSIESAPEFSYAHIREALSGTRSPDKLSGEEQAVYLDELLEAVSGETPEQSTFFKARQEKGLGVGLNEAGELTNQVTSTRD